LAYGTGYSRKTKRSIDYSVPSVEYYHVPDTDYRYYCLDGSELRKGNQTRVVMLGGHQNLFGYGDLRVIDLDVVPITKNYAMK
jgi:hypothetical protein